MKLVIVGNGFDLGSGLPTAYTDFFVYRSERTKNALAQIEKILNLKIESEAREHYSKFLAYDNLMSSNRSETSNKVKIILEEDKSRTLNVFSSMVGDLKEFDINFWDIYFWALSNHKIELINYNWFEIENEISNFLFSTKNVEYLSRAQLAITYEKILNLKVPSVDLTHKIPNVYFEDTLYNVNRDTKISALISCFLSHKKVESDIDFYDILLNQLLEFEEIFRAYIITIMDKWVISNKRNQSLYRNNFLIIIENGTDSEFYILNFNYTSITTRLSRKDDAPKTDGKLNFLRNSKNLEITENNVHGNFESISIFGIDQNDVKANSPAYIFTKTYRKIEAQSKLMSIPLPPKDKIDEIIFFGHSLSKADYSYFQSIFDLYDIYNSKIKLVFKYSLYGYKSKHRRIKNNQVKSVTQLIKSYGDTMSNQNHGNNLIHKLILENRISLDAIVLESIKIRN